MRLNPAQQAAVEYISGPCLVLAGAGSGKTRVITNKIAYLVNVCKYKPSQIAAVTFTNKAAREMKQRVSQTLGKKESRGLKVSTFHTLGLNIIKKHVTTLGYKAGFSLFDDKDSYALLNDLTNEEYAGDKDQLSHLQRSISNWKSELIMPLTAVQMHAKGSGIESEHAVFYQEYARHMQAYNALDFDDLILLPTVLLQQHQTIRENGKIPFVTYW
jgi:ATP-dependent DNA helicase Rep